MVEATLKNYRQSPRKVRLVADLVRGKKVNQALVMLDFLSKRAAEPVKGVLNLAVANAKHNHKLDPDSLYVREIRVDEGRTMKRYTPRARGSSSEIKKRASHIYVNLDTKNEKSMAALRRPAKLTSAESETELKAIES